MFYFFVPTFAVIQSVIIKHLIKVFNFHLGLAAFERRMQIRRFLQSETFVHTHRDTAVIAGGDFNDVWDALGKQLLLPAGFQPTAGAIKTFPAFMPMRPLDRVYFRGSIRSLNCFACRSQVTFEASDHRPLIVDFQITI